MVKVILLRNRKTNAMKTLPTILIFLGLLTNLKMFGQSYTTITHYDFETLENITISDNGIWEIGIPSKTDFNSAFQGSRAIITDSINLLPSDTSSFFYIVIDSIEIQKGTATILEFWHQFQLDETEDSASIDFSYDGGLSWYKGENSPNNYDIFYSRFFPSIKTENTYPDSVINGESEEWVRETYIWNWFYCATSTKSAYSDYLPDSIIVRFNIKSGDPIESREGWQIDSLIISYDMCTPICVNNKDNSKIYPNPFNKHLSIELDNALISGVELYNSLGQLINFESNINLTKYTFEAMDINRGFYYLKIYDNQKNIYIKHLIKNYLCPAKCIVNRALNLMPSLVETYNIVAASASTIRND
jgi:hypothetical protein